MTPPELSDLKSDVKLLVQEMGQVRRLLDAVHEQTKLTNGTVSRHTTSIALIEQNVESLEAMRESVVSHDQYISEQRGGMRMMALLFSILGGAIAWLLQKLFKI